MQIVTSIRPAPLATGNVQARVPAPPPRAEHGEGTPPPAPHHAADLRRAIDTANAGARKANSNIHFNYSDVLGQLVVQVVDGNSGEVIGQIPSRAFVAAVAAARQAQNATGLILNKVG